MKKILLLMLSLILLTGCASFGEDNKQDSLTKYESYLSTLIEQDRFTETSNNYDIYAVLNKLNDGTTRYDVILENPQIAMYNLQVLVVENTAKKNDQTIYPCIGIFDDESYSMIPNQINQSQGFIEAICLSGITKTEEPVLNVAVIWTDYTRTTTKREFIKLFPSFVVEEEPVSDDIASASDTTGSDVEGEKNE